MLLSKSLLESGSSHFGSLLAWWEIQPPSDWPLPPLTSSSSRPPPLLCFQMSRPAPTCPQRRPQTRTKNICSAHQVNCSGALGVWNLAAKLRHPDSHGECVCVREHEHALLPCNFLEINSRQAHLCIYKFCILVEQMPETLCIIQGSLRILVRFDFLRLV